MSPHPSVSHGLAATLRQWRHHLHRHPEVGFAEHGTGEFVATTLRELGVEVASGVGGTGVVGTLTRGDSTRSIGLRADMDGLALQEIDGREHGSRRDGVMHACGHDGHMTMLLGAAAALAADETFDGTVRFVFQPAEEHGHGAQAMLDDGLLERFPVDAMYGLHNIPGLPAGHLHSRPGAIMASEDNFTIAVRGRGGHASRPQAVIDPLLVAAEIIVALQSIVARSVDPLDTAVVSCTEVHGDGARNAIPTTVVISGDTRSFSAEVQSLLGRRIRQLSEGICAAHGATCEVTYTNSFRPTVNDPACTNAAMAAASAAVGADRVDGDCAPIMASEDFAAFAERIPACFVFIGNGVDISLGGTPLHSHDYDFNDAVLEAGVDFYVSLVRRELDGRAR